MITILHISDLHFVNNAASYNTEEILIREANLRVKDIPLGKKLLIVTGDFHNFSDDNYDRAKDFLKRLVSKMGIKIDQDVFVVPGNHDVGNKNVLQPLLSPDDKDWSNHQDSCLRTLKTGEEDNRYIPERLHMFRPYTNLVHDIGIYNSTNDDYDYPASTHIRCWRDKLNILHLNTALVADGKQKDNQKTDIDTAANSKTWEPYNSEKIPAIAIGHNSFYDLNKDDQLSLASTFDLYNVSAYLCGDTHKREYDPVREIIRIRSGQKTTDEWIPNLVAARSIADGKDNYSEVGYCWHQWCEESDIVEIEYRKWTPNYLAATRKDGETGSYIMRHKKDEEIDDSLKKLALNGEKKEEISPVGIDNKKEEILHRIRTLLARFQEEIKIDNSNGEFSINIHAENVLLKVLNVAYGLDLHNVNYEEGKTFPAIDLRDEGRRIAFQISSTGTVDKVPHTLKGCIKNGMDEQFDHLYFYFLKGMEKNVRTDSSRIAKEIGKFDISNIHFLDHAVFYQHLNQINDMGKLAQIKDLLEEQFADPIVYLNNNYYIKEFEKCTGNNTTTEQKDIINEGYKPTVFISYNNKSSDYVDELQAELQSNAKIIRYTNQDLTGVRPWESLRQFMKTISQQDFAVLIISKAYLESEACMYEVMELWKEDVDWNNKVMYVVMDDADIYTPIKRVQYVKYWQQICVQYINEIKSLDIVNAGNFPKQVAQYRWIAMNIGDFLDRIADSYNPNKEDAGKTILERILLRRQYFYETSNTTHNNTLCIQQAPNSLSFSAKIVKTLQERFRTQFSEPPENERVVQDKVQQFLAANGYKAGIDYERESGKFLFAGREYIPDFVLHENNPDFVFMKLNSAIEVKLLRDRSKKSRIIEEMNADYSAYTKEYSMIIFLVYDLGVINDVDEFARDFESKGNVSVIVIKH